MSAWNGRFFSGRMRDECGVVAQLLADSAQATLVDMARHSKRGSDETYSPNAAKAPSIPVRAQLTHVIEIEDEADLPTLQGAGTRKLGESCSVIASSSALMEEQFTLTGSTRGKPSASWSAVVRAENPEQAKAKALEEDDKRTITGVVRGAVELVG